VNVKSVLRQKRYGWLALVLWLLTSWGGVHNHFCVDGQEPAVSVHLDIMQGAHDSAHDQTGLDVDTDSGSLLTKLVNTDLPLLLIMVLFSVSLLQLRLPGILPCRPRLLIQRINALRPPLRAPPVIPV
jgi:hypothetical protein